MCLSLGYWVQAWVCEESQLFSLLPLAHRFQFPATLSAASCRSRLCNPESNRKTAPGFDLIIQSIVGLWATIFAIISGIDHFFIKPNFQAELHTHDSEEFVRINLIRCGRQVIDLTPNNSGTLELIRIVAEVNRAAIRLPDGSETTIDKGSYKPVLRITSREKTVEKSLEELRIHEDISEKPLFRKKLE